MWIDRFISFAFKGLLFFVGLSIGVVLVVQLPELLSGASKSVRLTASLVAIAPYFITAYLNGKRKRDIYNDLIFLWLGSALIGGLELTNLLA